MTPVVVDIDRNVVASFTFDGDPGVKARARVIQRGGKSVAYTPAKTKQAEEALGWAVRAAGLTGPPDGDGCFGVSADFFTASWQRRDVDNMLKLVLDACTGIVWVDDCQVTEVHATVVRCDPNPRTVVEIYHTTLQAPPGIVCRRCGKAIRIYPSWNERRFCSMECAGLDRRERVNITCATCGAVVPRKKSQTARSRLTYCSTACRSNLLTVTCAGCGVEFTRPLSWAGKFCSHACHSTWSRGKPRGAKP